MHEWRRGRLQRDTRQLPCAGVGVEAPGSLSREKAGGSLAEAGAIPYRATSDNASWFHIGITGSLQHTFNIPSLGNITMAYRETDPLLPRNSSAPEIQGSRPQSINEAANGEARSPDAGITSKPRMGLGDIYALLMGLVALAFIAMLIFPNGFKDVLGDGPQSIDDRVNSILSRTPLIGILSSRDDWPSKADRTPRWP